MNPEPPIKLKEISYHLIQVLLGQTTKTLRNQISLKYLSFNFTCFYLCFKFINNSKSNIRYLPSFQLPCICETNPTLKQQRAFDLMVKRWLEKEESKGNNKFVWITFFIWMYQTWEDPLSACACTSTTNYLMSLHHQEKRITDPPLHVPTSQHSKSDRIFLQKGPLLL